MHDRIPDKCDDTRATLSRKRSVGHRNASGRSQCPPLRGTGDAFAFPVPARHRFPHESSTTISGSGCGNGRRRLGRGPAATTGPGRFPQQAAQNRRQASANAYDPARVQEPDDGVRHGHGAGHPWGRPRAWRSRKLPPDSGNAYRRPAHRVVDTRGTPQTDRSGSSMGQVRRPTGSCRCCGGGGRSRCRAVAATRAAVERGRAGQAYDVVDEEPARWGEVFDAMADAAGAHDRHAFPVA